uniref:Cytochrome P450 monooxygenase CYP52X1 n=1 Tax=Ganoderma boninense TaxID=34458 RepID=A0A5K1JZ61_9APHY|nr:Cytochrome P450 monooxygenase CYP52X1 [Ganoderma boninense]
MCMYTLVIRARYRQGKCGVFLIVALLFFVFASLDVALLLRHILDAFIWYQGPGGAIQEFSDISYWVNSMKMVTFVAQTSIADGMLIYRCYIVYSGSWLAVAPLCILWAAGIVMEVFTCVLEFSIHGDATKLINSVQITPFVTSMLAITLALNTIATSLIVYKIWSIEHRSKVVFAITGGTDTTRLRRAMHIIIESGLMYTVSVVILFILYLTSNNAQFAVSDCGIAFNLIIIRIDQCKTTVATDTSMMTLYSGREQQRSGRCAHRSPVRFRFSRQTAATYSSTTDVDHAESGYGCGCRAPAVAVMAFKHTCALQPEPESCTGHGEDFMLATPPSCSLKSPASEC